MKNRKLFIILEGIVFLSMMQYGSAQIKKQRTLEAVADFAKSMPIGLSVNAENRLFVSFPNYDGDDKYALVEVVHGMLQPYPDESWNMKQTVGAAHFLRIQDLFVDHFDNLWVLDSKPAPGGDIFKSEKLHQRCGSFSLIKINTRSNKVQRTYNFRGLDKTVSALNDVRVDIQRQIAYLSDPGQAAIVVLDLKSGASRTVLAESKYTLADDIVLKYSDKEMRDKNGNPFRSDVNGMALTHNGRYLYFKPINKDELFKIETRYLRDTSLSKWSLLEKVENVGKVGITHGLIADKKGNIYLTTSESYSISYITPNGKVHQLVKDKDLLWPDSMGIGADGYLYVSCSQLQLSPNWNNGKDKTHYPYKAYKVQLPVE